jgi:tetratricopeptide (TPR) repeat protein
MNGDMNAISDSRGRGARWLAWGGVALVANSAYLAADGNPHMVYFGNVALHLVLGLALLVPFAIWWWRRRRRPLMLAAGLLLLAAAASGIALFAVGNTTPMRPLLWTHVALAVAGLLALLAALRARLAPRAWRLAAAGTALALVLPAAALALQSWLAGRRPVFENPPAAVAMADEAMLGDRGPFFPSSVHTSNRDIVPSRIYMDPQSCGRSGCHPDLVDQWESSAHHFSSMNNQWYRKSIEYMQEVAGVTSSKWCGGCHDPAILQSGLMDTPIKEIVDLPETQAGLTCTACHMISSVRSSMGQGDYEIEVPPLHGLATSDSRALNAVHDLLVRMDPEPHRRTFLKPFFRGTHSAEFCSSCHKVHLDVPVNGYRWIRGFNEYDNWQASGVSGQGARSFYYPAEAKNCVDCHMPKVPSEDAANKRGLIRSHRFAAANTALPVANRDPEQLKAVVDFLKAGQLTVDIFAMTEARAGGEDGAEPASEGPALSTSFAVGEESGMAVGAGGAALGPAEKIFAPLDRIPATVRRGESTRVDVVVRTRGVGHFFPGGTVDAYDCWLELKAVDDRGRVVYWSGMGDEDSPVEPGAHFYRSLLIDARGNPINKRNAWSARATVYVRLIPPGAADTVHFRLDVPPDAGDEIRLHAKLNYRKFSWYNTHFSFAGESLPGGEVTRDFDDRPVTFTGDTSRVSGKVKGVPRLPVVVVAEDTQVVKVVDAGTPLPAMERAVLKDGDRERWNDYGIGLFLQGDLRGARAAFAKVTEIEPGYVDGWVNRGRVALGEGDLEEARRVLARALAIDPELPRTHHFLGLLEKELGAYDKALAHFRATARKYPRDRVNLNQIGRVLFLKRDYAGAVAELQKVLAIDPEDLMAHYTLMLAARGAGDMEKAGYHQQLYERFKNDEASQILTGEYRERQPHDNNERQQIHEHRSVPAAEIEAFLAPGRRRAPAGSAVVSAGG